MGLYGGLTVEDIHKRKGLAVRDKILDFMGSTELIANLFRISQTEEKLKRDAVDNAAKANAFTIPSGVKSALPLNGSAA
jgi:DNA-damage-inducible protein D